MPPLNESNTAELYVLQLLAGPIGQQSLPLLQPPTPAGLGWTFVPSEQLPRATPDVFVEPFLRGALIRLNPEIQARPDLADEVLYKLRAILLSVRSDGLVRANEEFTAWARGDRSLPFGPNNEHTPVRLFDFDNPANNHCVVTRQFTCKIGAVERRADIILLINGIPVVLIEAKTPVRKAISWVDAAIQVHDDYEKALPELFVPNVFSVATEGKQFHYGSIGLPIKDWGPWNLHDSPPDDTDQPLKAIRGPVLAMLRPNVILDILAGFTLFATDRKKRRIKIICRYQQYDAANKIVARVIAGQPNRGLIWHFQGSGKSLLMVFAAQRLRLHRSLKNPTVLIVVDRIDLDSQITATFTASDIPNLEKAESGEALRQLLAQDARKIIITTIFKFDGIQEPLNTRSNIIVLVDEAHRTQEGNLGRDMRRALPHAFLFGLTGTPINRADRNTFAWFGAAEDSTGYLSRYTFQESIRDGATLPLHFEPRLPNIHVDHAAIDEAYKLLTGALSDPDRDSLAKTAAKMAVLLKSPERVVAITADIVKHFQAKVEPNGFKGQIVVYDRDACRLYKQAIDKLLPPETSAVVITVSAGEDQFKEFQRNRDEEERLLDRFRDPADPLKLLIVTNKLLTGFDAPILQTMYLDKPLRDHTLLQAICRVNRTFSAEKTHGLIVDYLGIFDDVAQALEFDDASIRKVISNFNELKVQLAPAVQECLAFFPGIDRSLQGYEALLAAQEHLPNNEVRDNFAAAFSYLNRLWNALSPDPVLDPVEGDYKWLAQIYQSIQPSSGQGRLLWHSLGAKTIDLIHQNVHVDAVRDDIETLVLDAELLEAVFHTPGPGKAKEFEIKILRRLRRHSGDPKFMALSERVENLRARHDQGLLSSTEFLKSLLEVARDILQAEKEAPAEDPSDRAKAALTELLNGVKNESTPIIVERVVADIDEIVRFVRFDGWQATTAGAREVQKALRKTLFKYRLHQDTELFDRAYGYIREYY